MSEQQAIYDTKQVKQSFIEFAEIELRASQENVFDNFLEYNNNDKLSAIDFIECLNTRFDLMSILHICFAYLLDSKDYHMITDRCISILNRKSYDYSSKDNRYSNFEIAREWSEKYLTDNHEINIVNPKMSFLILLGTKIARLTELLENGKTPNNESIEDSILDLMNYRLLLEGYILGLQ